MAIVMPYHTAD